MKIFVLKSDEKNLSSSDTTSMLTSSIDIKSESQYFD